MLYKPQSDLQYMHRFIKMVELTYSDCCENCQNYIQDGSTNICQRGTRTIRTPAKLRLVCNRFMRKAQKLTVEHEIDIMVNMGSKYE